MDEKDGLAEVISTAASDAMKKTVNAFEIVMSGGRAFLPKRETSKGMKDKLNNKDVLYNDLIKCCVQAKLEFPKSVAAEQGSYFVQVLCNALWYVTNHHTTIDETSRKQRDVQPVPSPFDQYTGYNDICCKKMKSLPMSSTELSSHAQAVFSLLNKPYASGCEEQVKACESIKALACRLSSYQVYLENQAKNSEEKKSLSHPPRTVDEHATIFHCSKTVKLKEKYLLLDTAVLSAGENKLILFNEDVHLAKPFQNSSQRFRFFDELQLSVNIDVIKYSTGGSVKTTFGVMQVKENRQKYSHTEQD